QTFPASGTQRSGHQKFPLSLKRSVTALLKLTAYNGGVGDVIYTACWLSFGCNRVSVEIVG
ncbi:MAG TPA: hypothetical protein VLZ28_05720, partial [Daejeonella sp.]|nr:hypothetical protein [Daejeonella sp.]